MADSTRTNADYARAMPSAAIAHPAKAPRATPAARRFRPHRWPTLAAASLLPLFIAAGQWQWDKAQVKNARQHELDARSSQAPLALSPTLGDAAALRDRTILASGRYEPERQILIDNRSHRGQAGYHVITPLHLAGSEIRLLVNRGWVPALASHQQLPQLTTPAGIVDIQGTAVLPTSRFFTLGDDRPGRGEEWQTVWQHLDMRAYSKAVDFAIQPVVVELDARSAAGGFIREWRRPDERVHTNLGYALQWWAFAATTVALWLWHSWRRPTSES